MALRWRNRLSAWKALYYIGGGFGYGMSVNAHFIGLTAAALEDQQGTAIGVYYLDTQRRTISLSTPCQFTRYGPFSVSV